MSYLNRNIKHLRKEQSLTQAGLAEKLGVKRSIIGAYEENRAEPKIPTIQKLAQVFGKSIDGLINVDFSKEGAVSGEVDVEGKSLRVLPIVVGADDKERIALVPVQARAGYTHSYSDPEYIGELPSFNLPLKELYHDKSYRVFQIEGDSMLPILPSSYIICEYIQDWQDIRDGDCYIVITTDGIVYKRVWNQIDQGQLELKSDNTVYEPYMVEAQDVIEIWKGLGYMSFDLPGLGDGNIADIQQIGSVIMQLKSDVEQMKSHMMK